LDIVSSVLEGLVTVRSVEAVRASVDSSEGCPVDALHVGTVCGRRGRDGAVIDKGGQLIAHSIWKGGLLDEVHPRGGVEGTLVNVLTDAVSFFCEDSIDSGYAIGCEICCGHNIKKLVVERGLIDRVPYFQLITLELFRGTERADQSSI
jgi:hypothetical protein